MTPHDPTLAPARRRVLILAATALAATAALILLPIGSVRAETLTVAAVNFRFEPETRTASVGDVVRWTFAGDPHTVTSGAPGAPDGRFDSGIKNPGESYQVTLNNAGTFRYFCAIHPEQMFGTIVVSGGSAATPTPTARPTARPTAKPTARPTARPTASPTATATETPTAAPTAAPSATPTATASATPAATTTPTASAAPSTPTASAGGSPTPEAAVTPDPGTAAAGVDPVPLVAAAIVVIALVGGGLVLARRSGRV